MKRLLSALSKFFRYVFGSHLAGLLIAGVKGAAPYIRIAYSIAHQAAEMTPTRADDEILALADALGVPAMLDPKEDKGIAIGRIVFRALKKRYPEAPERILNRAIEIAYGAIKP